MKLSRRDLGLAAAAGLAVTINAQTVAVPLTAEAQAAAAREANQRAAETLAKFEVPMATEPAFQFKA